MGRGGGGGRGRRGGGAAPAGPSGRQLRKERRKEERVKSKKRAAPLVPNFEGHDSDVRSAKRRVELFVTALKKSIEKEEERLTKYIPPKTPEQLEEERKKRRGSGLKGAARPAWEVYPELYPEMHKEEAPEETFDLLAKYSPNCYMHEETRGLVGLQFQLGHALLTDDALKGKGKQSQAAFKRALELDKSDPFDSRLGYFVASLERGEIVEESDDILRINDNDEVVRNAELLYHRALVLFMSSKELEEENEDNAKDFEDALMTAVEACPEIALALVHHEILSTIVDTPQVLQWLREERETRCAKAVEQGMPNRFVGRCDAGTCRTARAMAIAFCVNFAQYWIEGGIVESMAQMLDAVDVDEDADDDDDEEEEEEEGDSAEASVDEEPSSSTSSGKRWWLDRVLRKSFEDAALKFNLVAPSS